MQSIKYLIKNSYSIFICYSGILSLWLKIRPDRKNITFIAYHNANEKRIKKQLIALDKFYNIISLEEGIRCLQGLAPIKSNSLVITFDDGYADFYDKLFPIFQDMNIPATMFLLPHLIDINDITWFDFTKLMIESCKDEFLDLAGTRFSLKKPRNDVCSEIIVFLNKKTSANRHRILNTLRKTMPIEKNLMSAYKLLAWDEIKRMSGLITYGAHTQTHPNLATVDGVQARNEILGSKKRLEEVLQCEIKYFAYPFGDENSFTSETIEILKDTKFECALTLLNGSCRQGNDLYRLKRYCVDGNISGHALATLLSNLWVYI